MYETLLALWIIDHFVEETPLREPQSFPLTNELDLLITKIEFQAKLEENLLKMWPLYLFNIIIKMYIVF